MMLLSNMILSQDDSYVCWQQSVRQYPLFFGRAPEIALPIASARNEHPLVSGCGKSNLNTILTASSDLHLFNPL